MYYIHKKSNTLYKKLYEGLFQNEKGIWEDCVIYRNEDEKIFVRLKTDFDKSFKERD